jgi:soluble lytic murein transglycosylase
MMTWKQLRAPLLAFSFLTACATSSISEKELSISTGSTEKSSNASRKVASSTQEKAAAQAKKESEEHLSDEDLISPRMEKASNSQEQSITVTLAQVSRELKLSPTELRIQSHALNDFLLMGRLPNKSMCPNGLNSDAPLCRVISNLRRKIDSKSFSESSGDDDVSSARNSGSLVPIRPHHFNSQQNMHYARLMRSLSRESNERVLAWVPRMLEKRNCPRNLSAAALRKIENMLPDPRAQVAMEKLYEHASVCLRPQDPAYHPTHFRQALLRHLWGNTSGARVSITRASLSKIRGVEHARTLYWAGKLQSKAALRNQYWKKLVEDYPLTYHALEVWRHLKVDPYEVFTRRPHHSLTRVESNQDPSLYEALRWLESLYLVDKKQAAQKMANWIMERYGDEMSEGTLMYVSALKSTQNTPLNAILFLTKRVNENPEFLNEQSLRMLFPRPYLEIFHENSEKMDPFLLMAIARQESGFNPKARSVANARGLLQLLPSTAKQMAGREVHDLYDERVNVALGVKYLEGLVERFDSVELALAAYNAGPSRIPTWKRRYPTEDITLLVDLIPFKETRNYVSLIVRNNYWYERLYRKDINRLAGLARGKENRTPASSKTRSALVSRLVETHSASQSSESL